MTQKRKAITVGSKVRYTGESWYDLTNGKIYDVTSLAGDGFYVLDDVGCYNFIVSEDYEEFTDTPTLWRDMTPEEKGALLLAHHEGDVVQVWSGGEWLDLIRYDSFYEVSAYRIKPEPKVEVVSIAVNVLSHAFPQTLYGTIEVDDSGKPDPASIKMEEL